MTGLFDIGGNVEQERLIELLEDLFGGWEMNNLERAGPADQADIALTSAEAEALIAALKRGDLKIIVAEY